MSDVVVLSDCRSPGCRDWVRAGRPYSDSKPVHQFALTVSGHGFTVYTYPDKPHLTASRPEDHTPFSATGWPAPAPRWIGNAADVMQRSESAAGRAELARLARQIIADKDAWVSGTEWIKYLNWTDEDGNCWHVSWQPNKAVSRSTDKGHLHVSGRSDWVTMVPPAWDPVARAAGTTGEDEDMGATAIGIEIARWDPAGAPIQNTNINLGIVEGGAADPRPAWLDVTNDTLGADYGLRIFWTDGHGNFAPVTMNLVDPTAGHAGAGKLVLKSGWRAWVQLPKGAVALSVARLAVKDGAAVDPAPGNPPYAGSLGVAIERGAVAK